LECAKEVKVFLLFKNKVPYGWGMFLGLFKDVNVNIVNQIVKVNNSYVFALFR